MKAKKLLLVTSALFAISLTACGFRGGVDIEEDKTQLYVGIYEGGLESGAMYKIAQEFEKRYEDISFEEGKTGVQVVFSEARYSDYVSETIDGVLEEVFLDTAASVLNMHDKGVALDISDVYEMPMNYDFVRKEIDNTNSDSATFGSKVRSDRYDYYRDSDGKFYGVPGYSQYYGLVYDIDMFEEYNLFFSKNGGFITSKTEERSAGPDGDYATPYDNGLPATYSQFFELCDKIVSLDMTPVMWGGTVQEYVNSFLTSLEADYEGKEQIELNFNYNGTATNLIKNVNADGSISLKEPTSISATNGYELYRQAGRYYALSFLERLISNKKYYNSSDCTSLAFTNLDAQEQFLYSKYSSKRKRTAMLIEGSWWNKEASGVFASMAAEYGEKESQENRNIGLMPLPKATEAKVGEKYTVLERAVGDSFVKACIDEHKIDLAKSFVQYLFQNCSLVTGLQYDSQTKAFDFTLTQDEYNSLNPWAKTMYDLKTNAVTATSYSNSKMMRMFPTDLWYSPNIWNSSVNGTTYQYPTTAMINSGIKAFDYFEGLSKYMTKVVWDSKFSPAF